MMARTQSYGGALLLRFERDGEPDDFRVVPNGEAAVKVAVILLARRDALLVGDKLIVEKFDVAVDPLAGTPEARP
jgi:hypothetical protein